MVLRLIILLLSLFVLPSCTSVDRHQQAEKTITHHFGYQTDSRLSTYLNHPPQDRESLTAFFPLERGHDALLARLALIEAADKTLDLQYYIFRGDETGQLITWRLFEAAERGVRVRVLLDDMQKHNDQGLAQLSAHRNIEIRLFNPHQYRNARGLAMASDFSRLNRRMHNKSLTADSVLTIVGGRNVGNEYFSFHSPVEFGDFDLMLYGNSVQQTADQFDLYWNSLHAIPIEWIVPNSSVITQQEVAQWLVDSQLEAQFTDGQYDFTRLALYQQFTNKTLPWYWGKGQVWYDLPDKVESQSHQLAENLVSLLKNVEHSLVLISPYFVPTEQGTQALVAAAQRGVDITIVTNSLASNDVFAVHGWYAKYRQQLVEGGIKLWETKASARIDSKWSLTGSSRSSLHAKVMLIDHKMLFAGSMNWDPRSALLNTEMAAVIEHPDYVQASESKLPQDLKQSAYQVVMHQGKIAWFDHVSQTWLNTEPEASIWRRFGAWFAGVLPIEEQL
ncbi:TPA: phospholipase D family protein [Vibrio vulnificus]